MVSSVCYNMALIEATWLVNNAGRSRATGSLALCSQRGRTALSAEVHATSSPPANK